MLVSRDKGTIRGWHAVAIFAAFVCLGACDEGGVEERSVSKGVELPPEEWWSGERTPVERPAATVEPDWRVPSGWRRVGSDQPMRFATFEAPAEGGTLEVAVTRFGGDVGGELANINRWRRQMGLAPIAEDALSEAIERFTSDGFSGYVARVDGDGRRFLAVGLHDERADHTWFVRAIASPEEIDAIESELIGFARSIAIQGGE
jgi:hypothetical protein